MTDPIQVNQQGKEMPFGMKVVVSLVFLLLSLWFSLLIIDVVSAELILSINRVEGTADITKKTSTHGKNGYRYYYEYAFTVNQTEYTRSVLFQLFNKKTEVHRTVYESSEVGDTIPIYYASGNPRYNRPQNAPNLYKNFLWYILGIVVFGMIGLNELKAIMKKNEA